MSLFWFEAICCSQICISWKQKCLSQLELISLPSNKQQSACSLVVVAQFVCAALALNMQISPLSLVPEVPLFTLPAVTGVSELSGWKYHS